MERENARDSKKRIIDKKTEKERKSKKESRLKERILEIRGRIYEKNRECLRNGKVEFEKE